MTKNVCFWSSRLVVLRVRRKKNGPFLNEFRFFYCTFVAKENVNSLFQVIVNIINTENRMKKTLAMVAVAMMTAVCAMAQKIQVVDKDGNGIPLVSVLTEGGVLIGATDLDGVLDDVKGAAKVSLTHVAFKPKKVSVASLTDGRIMMDDVDYDIAEVVVKPKPYVCTEYYFRGFSYIGDSLRVYAAGIIPVAYEIQKKYAGKIRNVWSFGGAANKALAWNLGTLRLYAEKGVKNGCNSIESLVRQTSKFKEHYQVEMEPDGENRWIVKNPEGVVGHFVYDDGLYRATLDGGKMQIYANKVNGSEKRAKLQEEKNYDYQYTEVFALDDEGKVQPYNNVMQMGHWEHDSSKGREITIIYIYAVDHKYVDEDEFKARSKELNKGFVGDMPLADLQEYERINKIPALAPEQLKAIQELTMQTGKKKK